MKRIKYLIMGFLIFTVMFTSVPVLADTLDVLLGKIKVTVNGKDTELTLLSYDDELYVPLASVLEMLEDTVDWKKAKEIEAKQAESINTYTLGPGKYVVGDDIPEGKYTLVALSGYGRIAITGKTEQNVSLAKKGEKPDFLKQVAMPETFSNLNLNNDDNLKIIDTLTVQFKLQ